MKQALVFFDLDGTLLGSDQRVPDSARKAIARLRANGHLALINTGRCMAMVTRDILSIGFDGVVAACGTHVTWGSETLTNVLIPQDLLRETLMLMIEHNMDFWLEGPDHVYLDAKTHPEFYQAFIDSFPAWPDLFMDFRVKNPLRINKFSYLLQSGSRFDAVRSFLIRHYDVIFHRDEQGEVVPCGYSKATGMDLIRRRLGNPDVVTFAFGDSLNDLAMFQAADVGIAMDGSHSRLIASSSHLTASPDEHGIERALRYYQLIS